MTRLFGRAAALILFVLAVPGASATDPPLSASSPTAPPVARLSMELFVVSGVTKETAKACATPTVPIALDGTLETLARAFGGTSASQRGSAQARLTNGIAAIDTAALVGRKRVYVGLRGSGGSEIIETVNVAVQPFGQPKRTGDEWLLVPPSGPAWSAHLLASEDVCLVVRVDTGEPASSIVAPDLHDAPRPVEQDVQPPKLEKKVQPAYPEAARIQGREGKVVVQAIIDKEGRVRWGWVLAHPPASPDLAVAALDAVLQWRFKPALLNGKPISVYFTLVATFDM